MTHRPLRALIVEDEPVAARRLQRVLHDILGDRLATLTRASDLDQAAGAMVDSGCDLILLDLDLDGQDGFALLDLVASASALTIIVSAHAELAVRAFEYGVVDFVPKPYTPQRLKRALARLETPHPEREGTHRFLGVQDRGETRVVDVLTIERIAAAGDYAELTLVSGEGLLHARSLDALMVTLPDRFARVHRSHIVNLDRIVRLRAASGGRYAVELRSGVSVPVGRRRYPDLKARLAGPAPTTRPEGPTPDEG